MYLANRSIMWILAIAGVHRQTLFLATASPISTYFPQQRYLAKIEVSSSKVTSGLPFIEETSPMPSTLPSSSQSLMVCEDITDSDTFRFNNDPRKDCSTWVSQRPFRRCPKIDPVTNQKVKTFCPRTCNKICREVTHGSKTEQDQKSLPLSSQVPSTTINPISKYPTAGPSSFPTPIVSVIPSSSPSLVVSPVPTEGTTRISHQSAFPSNMPSIKTSVGKEPNRMEEAQARATVTNTGTATTKWVLLMSSGTVVGIVVAFCGGFSRGKQRHLKFSSNNTIENNSSSTPVSLDSTATSPKVQNDRIILNHNDNIGVNNISSRNETEDEYVFDGDSIEISFQAYSINECFASDDDDVDDDDSWSMSAISSLSFKVANSIEEV